MKGQLRSYSGSGVLHYGDGTSVECTATAAQDHDGSLTLTCSVSDGTQPLQWLGEIFGDGKPMRFEGTSDGLPMAINGGLHATESHLHPAGMRTTYEISGAGRLEIGTLTEAADTSWRFGIANLLFESPDITNRPDGGIDRSQMHLSLGGQPVTLQRSSNYTAAKEDLKRRHRIRVTAEAVMPATLDFASAQELIASLCALLSIAQGTLINSLYCDQFVAARHSSVYRFHNPAVTRPYNGALPLIHPDYWNDLPRFLESTFDRFTQTREERGLRRVAQAYSDFRTTGFLEARALQALSLIEFIIGTDATIHRREVIVPQPRFDAVRGRVEATIRPLLCLAFPESTPDQIRQMCDHLQGLNYSSFARRLKETAERLGATIERNEIRRVRQTRNDLVHRMVFSTPDQIAEFFHILSVLDRLVMGLLGYRGSYVDAVTKQRIDPTAVEGMTGSRVADTKR